MGDFVHLHLHSEYSLLDGACRIAEIPKAAKAAGHNAVAITDHGVLYGAVAFYKACIAEGIKPIIGCEVYVARRSMYDREKEHDAGSCHLVLLVKDQKGWENLTFLVSKAFTDGFYSKPRIDIELLESHTEGLVCLSACLAGYIPRCIVAGEYEKAEEYAIRLDKAFGRGNFYLELQDHGLSDDDVVCKGVRRISEKTGIPLVATNDVHYLKKADSETQAILMCIQTNNVITDGKPIGFETDEFYYKNTPEMEKLFRDTPEACTNTQKIADMCNFDFTFGETKLPRYHPENGMTPGEYLSCLANKGLSDRVEKGHIVFNEASTRETYDQRIEYELQIIEKMGYSEYYLIVWDFVNHAKSIGIPVGPGRGSGAGSIVAYLIGITDIDPIRFNLLFERFLNPERVSMPDFDIDFCYDRRDEAINYVRNKYGEDHTAQIVTFGTLAARAAVRDVGRALGMSYSEVDEVAKKIPQAIGMSLEKAMHNKDLQVMYDESSDIRKLIDTAIALEGMPRHASTHAAGVVITENPVTSYVPIAVNNGVLVTQFDMDTIAELGLLKFDFLALRYLTIINNAELQIRENDPSFDLTKVDVSDSATYDTLCAGRCDGIFQLESTGIRQMIMQLKPRTIDDIIAAIALYRPGPMDSIPKYIESKQDPSKIHYCTSKLAPILDVTYGCIVYQEQVMQIFREIAGYSFGHADVVRRAISKKKQGVLDGERQNFIEGAVAQGIDESEASDLFESIVSFANYAFNKSHAAAYAVLSFRTAYLKTHFPLEYESALLTSVISSTDKLSEYVADCAKQKITILPPDVNKSVASFHVEGNAIRFGLAALKNVGEGFINQLVAERKVNGDYEDASDFIFRMQKHDMNKRQLEMLVKSGSMDSLGTPRSQLLAVYDTVLEKKSGSSGVVEGQIGMFDMLSEVQAPKPSRIEFPQIPELSMREKLSLEKESCGLYLTGHVLDDYGESLSVLAPMSISQIREQFRDDAEDDSEKYNENNDFVLKDKSSVTIAGCVVRKINKNTKSGEVMAFVTIEDRSSSIEMLVFPKNYEKFGYLVQTDTVIAVSGTLSVREDEDVKLIANKIIPLVSDMNIAAGVKPDSFDDSTKKEPKAISVPKIQVPSSPKKIYLRVDSEQSEAAKRSRAICQIFEGTIPVIFYFSDTKEYQKTPIYINAAPFVLNELSELLGAENVVVK